MHFDHLDPAQKKYNVSSLKSGTVAGAAVTAEIAKCELVCANCHAERTHARGYTGHVAAKSVPVKLKNPRPVRDQLGNVYKNQREAAKATGVSQGEVSRVANKKQKHTHGYVFCWADE
jgi:hypothetical protein